MDKKMKEKFKSLRLTEKVSIIVMLLITIVNFTCNRNIVQIGSIFFLIVLIIFFFIEMINRKTPAEVKDNNFFVIVLSIIYIASIIYIRQR